MPPKPKFTREEIVATALKLVSEKGVDALTAKELRDALGCSASPIFTLFSSMREIQNEVRVAAMRRFDEYVRATRQDMPIFKQVGLKMVLFGVEEPKLYQLLFMQENRSILSFDDVFGELGQSAQLCIDAVERDYGLSAGEARLLFENVWIYTFGVGALCATHGCSFSEAELSAMLSAEFQAMMLLIHSRRKNPGSSQEEYKK